MGGRSSPGGLGFDPRGFGADLGWSNHQKNWASATGEKARHAQATQSAPKASVKRRLLACPIAP
jgi:hypothetical protein